MAQWLSTVLGPLIHCSPKALLARYLAAAFLMIRAAICELVLDIMTERKSLAKIGFKTFPRAGQWTRRKLARTANGRR
jgi:hypothetical protein